MTRSKATIGAEGGVGGGELIALPGNDYTETLVVPVVTNGQGYGRTYFKVKALNVGQAAYSACAPGN